MSAASDILKFFNLFVDGIGFAGQTEELQLPNLTLIEEDFRAGGMFAPLGITMGLEKLEASFTLPSSSVAVMSRFAIEGTQLTARGSLESFDGSKTAVAAFMRGKIKADEKGAWQPGQKSTTNYSASLSYYRYEQGGRVIHEIDVLNMICVINGVDIMAEHRANIGM